MMRKILHAYFLFAVLMIGTAQAQDTPNRWKLSADEIEANARQFAVQLKQAKAAEQVTLQAEEASDFVDLRIYNIEGGGWVIASGDSRIRSILAYSDEGVFVAAEMPEGVRYWLQGYEEEIASLGDLTPQALERIRKKEEARCPSKSAGTKDLDVPDHVDYLLPTIWGQSGYGYNNLTPYDYSYGGHVTVGCTALAMGQLMRYYSYPWHGYGSHSYSYSQNVYGCWRYGTLSADFSETMYDYYSMPAQLTDNSTPAEVEAVSTLLYHCGVASNMVYNMDCGGSSGASFESLKEGAWRYFHFNPEARLVHRSNFARWQWIDTLKEEIGHGRPVVYAGGQTTYGSKHAFVLDGYDQSNYFHINWGWHGSSNGYYSFDSPQGTAEHYFSGDQYCLLDFQPVHNTMPVIVMGSDLQLDSTVFFTGEELSGSYVMTNIGDARGDCYVALWVYSSSESPVACVDQHHFSLAPGSTQTYSFSLPNTLEAYPLYSLRMQVSRDSITETPTYAQLYRDYDYSSTLQFAVVDTTALCNLVLYAGFAEEASYSTFGNLIPIIERNFKYFFQPLFNPLFNHQVGVSFAFPMRTQTHGEICHFIDPHWCHYYQPYDPQQVPAGDPDPYPECGPSQREVEFVGRVAHYIDSLHFVDSTARLDNDKDGTIDHLVIVMSRVAADQRRGMLADHTTRYPDTLPPLTINGLRVDRYSLIGTNDTVTSLRMASAISHALGLPNLEHKEHYPQVHPDATGSILATSMNAPSAIFKQRYLGIGDEPVQISADGTYTLNSSDLSMENNLYYIKSAIDSNQWYLVEYRTFGTDESRNGLYISRWMDTMPQDACYGGNAWADFNRTPNAFWTFRRGSSSDTIEGYPTQANFSQLSGRRYFSPVSNPHPYLADGTPEVSFKITNIVEDGESCTFDVHFFTPDEDPYAPEVVGISLPEVLNSQPAVRKFYREGEILIERNGVVYDLMGRRR